MAKHTIKGHHGHTYELLGISKSGKPKTKPICIPASESAELDYLSETISLRQTISRRWRVCMWCWSLEKTSPAPAKVYGLGKLSHYECGSKCPSWKLDKPRSRKAKNRKRQV